MSTSSDRLVALQAALRTNSMQRHKLLMQLREAREKQPLSDTGKTLEAILTDFDVVYDALLDAEKRLRFAEGALERGLRVLQGPVTEG